MKTDYAESNLLNPQYNFKKEELKQMKKIEIMKSIAEQEQMQNIIHIANSYDKKIPLTSLNLKLN